MTHHLDTFARECRDILKDEPGAPGRRKVVARLEHLLGDRPLVRALLNDEAPARRVLYEDPELGFCIVAHNYAGARRAPPHDHGPTWAIYGQAKGETQMTDYELVSPPVADRPGMVRALRSYRLAPGMAHLYNEGDLHAPSFEGSSWLLRIEGRNTERFQRARFEVL